MPCVSEMRPDGERPVGGADHERVSGALEGLDGGAGSGGDPGRAERVSRSHAARWRCPDCIDPRTVVGCVAIVLCRETKRLGLHAQVDVLADHDDLAAGKLSPQLVGHIQDLVIGRARLEGHAQVVLILATHLDDDVAQVLTDLNALAKQWLLRQPVDSAQELARVKIDRLVPFLEPIKLLQHRDGNNDVVLLELIHAFAVVKDDVGASSARYFSRSSWIYRRDAVEALLLRLEIHFFEFIE